MRKFLILLALVGSTTGCAGIKILGCKVVPQPERWKEKNDLVCRGHKQPCILYVSVKADTEREVFEKCHKDLKEKSKMAGFKKMKGRGFFDNPLKEGYEHIFEGRCKALVE